MRPSTPAMGISESTMLFSRATSLCRSRCARIGWLVCASRLVSASESVVYPVLIRLVLGRPSSVNRTSCSCLGEPRLNSCPVTAYAACSVALTSPPRLADMPARWSTSAAIPACSIAASTPTRGSSTSWSSRVTPRSSSTASSASASSAVARARWASAFAASASPSVSVSKASWPTAASSPPVSLRPAYRSRQVGQVERALAGQRQVGGERGVAGQAAELQAARGQRVHRPLGVVQRLGLLRVGQPGGQRALVVLGQRGRVEVGVGAVGGGQRQPVEHPGAAAPGPRWPPGRCGRRRSRARTATRRHPPGRAPRPRCRTPPPSAAPSSWAVGSGGGKSVRESLLEPFPQDTELQRVEELVQLLPVPGCGGQLLRRHARAARPWPAR